jgi:O-antigen/teichoic acid export membrane protein
MFPDERRRLAFSRERAAEVWRFSRLIALSSIISMLLMQADKLVFARVMPLSVFGMYAIAANLALAPTALASLYASRILFPVFSHHVRADRASLSAVYYERQKIIPRLYTFAVGGLIGCAPLVVELLYDPRYRGVATFLSLLAISPMLMMTTHIAEQALIALGRVRATLSANVGRILWLTVGGVIGFWFGGPYGLIAIVGTMEVAGILVFWWELSRVHLLDLRQEAVTLAAGWAGVVFGSLFSATILHLAGIS